MHATMSPPTARMPLHSMTVPQLPCMQQQQQPRWPGQRRSPPQCSQSSPLPMPQSDAFSPTPLPVAKWQRGEDEQKIACALVSDGASLLPAPSPAPAAPCHPWAHLSSSAPGNTPKLFRVKREAPAPPARERASLLPAWPDADAVVASGGAPPFRSAFDLWQERDERPCLSLGDACLDAPLQGGLREGITELVGEAACGKTQMAMQLMLQCQLPKSEGGLDGGALFLAVEDVPIARLRTLAAAFQRDHPQMQGVDVLNKIFIKNIRAPLRHTLTKGDVKFIVLDSVAALFRAEQVGKEQDFSARSQELLAMAATLKHLSATFHVPVLVVNQVSDFFAGADANGGQALQLEHAKHSYLYHWSLMSSGRRVVPALGLTWSNCVNTRIFLTRKHEFMQVLAPVSRPPLLQPMQPGDAAGYNPLTNMFTPRGCATGVPAPPGPSAQLPLTSACLSPQEVAPPPKRIRRFMHVQFAPHLPPAFTEFVIDMSGIRGTPNVDVLQGLLQQSPAASPASASPHGASSALDPVPMSSSSVPQLHTFQPHFYPTSMAPLPPPSPPAAPPTTFMRNMFTPSGQPTAVTSSPPAGASSYFDGPTEEDEREELLMLQRAEEEMRQRQEAQYAAQTISTVAQIMSPPQHMPQQQQQWQQDDQPQSQQQWRTVYTTQGRTA